MLPREVIEELLSGGGPTGSYVLVSLADGINSLLVVLALPIEIVGERIIERISGALAAAPGVLLQLGQSLRLDGYSLHTTLKLKVRPSDVNSVTRFCQRALRHLDSRGPTELSEVR